MADGLEHACWARVQTVGLRNLTDAGCMPDLTVEEYGGEGACEERARGYFTTIAVGRARVRVRNQGFVQYVVHPAQEGGSMIL